MIEVIREKASQFDWQNIDAVIDFYEDNLLFFDNYKILNELDTIIDVINMKSHYIGALILKHRYKKAQTHISQIDYLLESIKEKSVQYEKLRIRNLFQKGVIYGYLKLYKPSYEIFTQLKEIDPENDLYKDWYVQMKTNLLYKKIQIIGFIGLAIVFGDIISGLAFNYDFDNRIVLFGFILLLLSYLIPVSFKYLNKKNVTKNTNKL